MKILHLEDDPGDSFLVERGVQRQGISATFIQVRSPDEFFAALKAGGFDVVLVDNNLPGFGAKEAIEQSKASYPDVPVIVCSGAARDADVAATFAAGANDYVLKDYTWQLAAALRRNAAVTASSPASRQTAMLLQNLENQVRERTRELQVVNQELEAFSFAVSHDLRAPLRAMNAELELASDASGGIAAPSVAKLRDATGRMGMLIDDLLRLSRISRAELRLERFDLSAAAQRILNRLRAAEPERSVEWSIEPQTEVNADPGLMAVVLENLLSNAWKYSSKRAVSRIELSSRKGADDQRVYCISDNGAGFDPRQAPKLFKPFTRLHDAREFPGIGVGLATVQRIIQRHGGQIWAESDGKSGAQFMFTLGAA